MRTSNLQFALLAVVGGFGLSACNNTGFTAAPSATVLGQTNPMGGGSGSGGTSGGGGSGTGGTGGSVGNTNPTGCTIGTAKKPIRIMFMIDNSGSTLTTDPKQTYRALTLQKFISDYGANTNLSYNFAYFAGTTALSFDMVTNIFATGVPANPVGNATQFATAVKNYEAIPIDSSAKTPYMAAFNALSASVSADEASGHKQDYAVVFMSDGQPTDITGIANLKGLVDTLKTTVAGNGSAVTVNTVYFGDNSDNTSKSNLLAMSTEGAGQFVNTNMLGAGGLVINDVINVPGASCD